MTTDTALLCPKDQSPMRTYERNGVTINRCAECGGVAGCPVDARRHRTARRCPIRGGFLGDLLDLG